MEVKQVRDLMEAYASVYSQPEQEVISEDPIQDYRDRKRASENAGGARGPELSHGGPSKGKPQPGSATTKPQPRSREFAREDLQQTVGDVLDTAAKNPVIKAIGNVIAPVGKGRRTVTKAEQERKIKRNVTEESDLFDFILEYLVAEGYADTNQSALVIMANMSEEWRQSIVEQLDPDSTGGNYNDFKTLHRINNMMKKMSPAEKRKYLDGLPRVGPDGKPLKGA